MSKYRSSDGIVYTIRYSRGQYAGRFVHTQYSLEYPESLTANVRVLYSTHPRPLWLTPGDTYPEPGDKAAALDQLEADLAGPKLFLPPVLAGGLTALHERVETDTEISATYYMQKQVRSPPRRLDRWLQSSDETLEDQHVRRSLRFWATSPWRRR